MPRAHAVARAHAPPAHGALPGPPARPVRACAEFLNTDGEHEHDTSVTSIGIDIPGDVNLSVLQDWFGKVLQEKATDIYRMKGILAIENEKLTFIISTLKLP